MSIRTQPTSPTVAAILKVIARKKITAYRLAKESGLTLYTVQRFMNSQGSPTIHTIETIAKTLEIKILIKG
ncbi:MAG: XRE family transcriptional regulator [Planctomycetota bacterium]|nr:MAG: XRE family transcriptional regulator [Planctomycetota bacterium]